MNIPSRLRKLAHSKKFLLTATLLILLPLIAITLLNHKQLSFTTFSAFAQDKKEISSTDSKDEVEPSTEITIQEQAPDIRAILSNNPELLEKYENTFEKGVCDELVVDDTTPTCFFFDTSVWESQSTGYLNSAKYAPYNNPYGAGWASNGVNGRGIEVFVTIPTLSIDEELEPSATYSVLHAGGFEDFTVDQAANEGTVYSLGTFDFNGRGEVWLRRTPGQNTTNYVIADAVSFGVPFGGSVDLTPPEIKNVKAFPDNGQFIIEAEVTDVGSGVRNVNLYFNGAIHAMQQMAGSNKFALAVPYSGNQSLSYYILAYDNAGNEAIWSPGYGYMSRSMFAKHLGYPAWLNYYGKCDYLSSSKRPCSSSANSSGITGDPINTYNGNLIEQVKVVAIPGRAPIDLHLTYNSQGGRPSTFGENWTHSYNYNLLEMENQYFQGVFIQYPDGRVVKFSGPGYTPEPGNFERLQRLRGEGFILYFKDLTQVRFDIDGDISRWQDANGNGVNFEFGQKSPYTMMSQMTKITSDGGRSVTLEYNPEGLVNKVITAEGKEVEFFYDSNFDLVKIIDARDNETNFEYDNHRMTKKFSPEGHTYFKNLYDTEGRISEQINGASHKSTYAYSDTGTGKRTTVTDAYGNVTTYDYDGDGLLVKFTDPKSNYLEHKHNPQKKVIETRDKDGNVYQYDYDTNGNRTYEKDPLGHEIVRVFDQSFNKPTYEKYKEADHITKWSYDMLGNLKRIENGKQDEALYTYNDLGQLTEAKDFNGNITKYTYNGEGDLESVTDALNQTKSFYYDGVGRLTKEVTARQSEYLFTYDRNDNLKSINGPLGYSEGFVYDKNNNLTSQIDANGGITLYKYDTSENLIEYKNQLGNITTYSYGLMNELKEVVDAEGRITKYEYDPVFNLITKTAAAGTSDEAVTRFEYTGMSDLLKLVDPENRVTKYEYDPLRRVSAEIQNFNALPADQENNVTTRYFYTPSGALEKVVDPNQNETIYELDQLDQVIKSTDAEGNETQLKYFPQGNLEESIDPELNSTLYQYDGLNRIKKITDALTGVTTFEYDPNGNLSSVTDANGVVTKYEYNELDRKTTQIQNFLDSVPSDPETNVKTRYEYDTHGNLTKVINPRGFNTQFGYDPAHRNTSIVDHYSYSTAMQYDKVDNLKKVTDRSGNEVKYIYDNLNRVVENIDQEALPEKYSYDDVGNLVQLINRRNKTFTYEYDPLNRVKVSTDPYQKSDLFTYDAIGNRLTHTDKNSHQSSFSYDKIYRLKTSTDAEGNTTQYFYDGNSNLTKSIDAELNPTEYQYDELNRVIAKTNAESETEEYDYDNISNRTLLKEADGTLHKFSYDKLYRLGEVINNYDEAQSPDNDTNVITKYQYDANGNRTKVIDPLQHTTSFEYDELDRLVKEINALENSWSYQYDKVGNMKRKVDANGAVTLYDYYPDYQLQKLTYPNHLVSYQYNETNAPTQMSDNLGITTWDYDDLDRVTSQKDAFDRTLSYQYDFVGNLTKLTYPDQKFIEHSYLDNNWLYSSTTHDGDSSTYTRNKVGASTYIERSNSSYSDLTYDRVYRPTLVDDHQIDGGDHLIHTFEYQYNEVGHISQETANYGWRNPGQVVTTFEYDGLHRVTAAIDDDSSESRYQYDAAGNRLVQTEEVQQGTETRTFEYNSVNQITQIEVDSPRPPDDVTHLYSYDNNGNRTQRKIEKSGVDLVTDYSYDVENRLLRLENSNQNLNLELLQESGEVLAQPNTTDLQYDGNGRRLVKTFTPGSSIASAQEEALMQEETFAEEQGKRTEYLFSGMDPVAEFDTWNGQYRNYYRDGDNDLMFFQKFSGNGDEYVERDLLTGEELSRDPNGTIYFYHYDGEGNIGATSKHQGQSDHAYRYDEYGAVMPENGNWTEPHNQYTLSQKEVDSYMGLYYFGSRHYDPYTGSWISQDSYRGEANNPMSQHRYMYNYNSPVNYVDWYGYSADGGILPVTDLQEYSWKHAAVQSYFITKVVPGAYPEFKISGASSLMNGNIGYADVVDLNGPINPIAEIWEIKHFSPISRATGPVQLQNYISNFPGVAMQGHDCGEFVVPYIPGEELVVKSYDDPGMLYYYERKSTEDYDLYYKPNYVYEKLEQQSVNIDSLEVSESIPLDNPSFNISTKDVLIGGAVVVGIVGIGAAIYLSGGLAAPLVFAL